MARHIADPRLIDTLARLMAQAGLSQRALARAANVSPGFLSDILNGKKAPSLQVATALDRALGADHAIASLIPVGVTDADHDQIGAAIRNPANVTAATVAALQRTLNAQRELDDTLGSAAMLRPVSAHLEPLTAMAHNVVGVNRPALMRVAAQWAQFAGWLHMSVGRWDDASGWLGRALSWALEADDPDLSATAQSYQAHLAWLLLRPGQTAGQAEAVLRDERIYPGQLAYDAFQAARAYACLGDIGYADRLLAVADRHVERAGRWVGDLPPWQYQRDTYVWRLERGLALYQVAVRQPSRLPAAVAELRAGYRGIPERWRGADWAAEYGTHLAAALIRAGELDEASMLLDCAGRVADATRSARVARLVRGRERRLLEARGWD